MPNRRILFIFGTRPEAIKLYPLMRAFNESNKCRIKICNTSQHKDMVRRITDFFDIKIDYDLNVMEYNQSLFQLTATTVKKLEPILKSYKPDLIFVQGDTTSTFIGALAAYYLNIKVAHIEAGLRSFNKRAPFPEEINRVLTDHVADYHFVPTEKAKENLMNEGIKNDVWVVGNTVIDALFLGLRIIKRQGESQYFKYFNMIDFTQKVILVTAHRRESFGEKFNEVCQALTMIARKFPKVEIVYPVHLNPNINKPAHYILKGVKNIHLIKPLIYPYLIWLMNKSYIVLTDSGGIQEEAPSLGKPVLVLRDVTERTEGVEVGNAILVGTKKARIFAMTAELLTDSRKYTKMSKVVNPYGDGKSAKRIVSIIDKLEF